MHLLSASDIDAEEFRFGVHLGPQNFHGICYLLGRCKENTERSEQVGASLLCQVDDECGESRLNGLYCKKSNDGVLYCIVL